MGRAPAGAATEVPLPELMPEFSEVNVDALGDYWVAEYAPLPGEVTEWRVFAPTGEILGRASLPPGLDVHEIGAAYLLGVESDDLDVQYVRRYRLARIAPAG